MALQTQLEDYVLKYSSSSLDKQEHRPQKYPVWNHFLNDAPNLLDADTIEKAKAGQSHVTKIPVLSLDQTVSVSNVRSCTIPVRDSDSQFFTVIWATYAASFDMKPSQYRNNYIKEQDDFQKKLNECERAIASALETQAVLTLETDKSQVSNSFIYPFIGDAHQVTNLQANDMYNNIGTIMAENEHFLDSNINVLSSTSGMSLVNRLSNQGSNNAINEQFQLSPYKWAYSNFITNDAGVRSTIYAMPEKTCAALTWIDIDCQDGADYGDRYWGVTPVMPLLGVPMGIYMTKNCSDEANQGLGIPGLERTRRIGCELSLDAAFLTAWNSDHANKPGSIFKFQVAV